MSLKWEDEDLKFLKDNYQTMESKEIANILGRTRNSIVVKANRMGLAKPQKYFYDLNYFENIDSEEKAYWLGFIYADGYISTWGNGRNNCFGIEISSIDEGHLRKFNNCIEGNFKISHRKREMNINGESKSTVNMCSIRIHSKDFNNHLLNKGVFYNKTSILEFPKFLSKEMTRHFVRGYIDGDGYISFHKRTTGRGYGYVTRFGFVCHSEGFTLDMKRHIEEELNLERELVIYKDRNSFSVDTANQKQLLSIVEYLYEDSTIHLDRKYESYKKLHHYLLNKLAYRKRNLAM